MYCNESAIVTNSVLLRYALIGAVIEYPKNLREILLIMSKTIAVTGVTPHANATISTNLDDREWNNRGACAISETAKIKEENEKSQKYVTLALSDLFIGDMNIENQMNSIACPTYHTIVDGVIANMNVDCPTAEKIFRPCFDSTFFHL